MRILHVKGSDLAWAPDAIAEATNKWTGHAAEVWKMYDDEKSGFSGHAPTARGYDIIHFHNKPRIDNHIAHPRWNPRAVPSLIQYHSEPGPRVDLTYDQGPRYVVAQYQMTLPEYADCKPMRNIINFIDNPLYDPITICDKIRVAYSPSILHAENKWYDKGARETIPILERLKAKYPDRFDFDLIHGVPLEECLARKRMCNVVIDECVTGSYHRSGLEGLAMGKLTITGKLDDRLVAFFRDAYKSAPNEYVRERFEPFRQVGTYSLHSLKEVLIDIIEDPDEPIMRTSKREWMEANWHPRDIVNEWIREYEKVLNG